MGTVLMIVGGLLSLVGFVCWVIVIINAFKTDTTQGILCLCVPFYILYWAFARFTHPKKGLLVGGMLAGYFIGGGLLWGGMMMNAAAAIQSGTFPGMPGMPGTTTWPPAQ